MFSKKLFAQTRIKLFDSFVKTTLFYCCEIWGLNSLNSKNKGFTPNKVLIKNAKYILGVNKGNVNIAVFAELGLLPFALVAVKASIWFWDHLIGLNENCLAKRGYNVNTKLKGGFLCPCH